MCHPTFKSVMCKAIRQYTMFMYFSFDVTVIYLLLFPTHRIVEEWSSKYRAEELYMMKRQIDGLTECLSSAMDNFPVSCSSLEGMRLSSLRRWFEYVIEKFYLGWSPFCIKRDLQHRILIGIRLYEIILCFFWPFSKPPDHLLFGLQNAVACPLLSKNTVTLKWSNG